MHPQDATSNQQGYCDFKFIMGGLNGSPFEISKNIVLVTKNSPVLLKSDFAPRSEKAFSAKWGIGSMDDGIVELTCHSESALDDVDLKNFMKAAIKKHADAWLAIEP